MTGFEGFFNSAAPYLWLISLLGIIGLAVWLWRVQRRASAIYKKINSFIKNNAEGEGLEELLLRLRKIERDASTFDIMQSAMRELELRQNRSYQSVGLVRFNPFTDMGGDQSFALAILDSYGDGFVMSSLHGRTATRVYAKTVRRGQPTQTVSTEEMSAIEQAMRYQQLPPDDRDRIFDTPRV
jgi:hypothetical protein